MRKQTEKSVAFDPRNRDPGWVKIKIRDEYPGSYFRELKKNFLSLIYKFFDAFYKLK
jgi:hypothetical protein